MGSNLRDATAVDPPVMPEVYSLTIPNLAAESRKRKALTRRWNGHLQPQPRLVQRRLLRPHPTHAESLVQQGLDPYFNGAKLEDPCMCFISTGFNYKELLDQTFLTILFMVLIIVSRLRK